MRAARVRPRHRRPRLRVAAVAERLWRPPLVLAAIVFAACGPAHALGHTDLVFWAVLVGLGLSAFAVPVGMLALRHEPAVLPAHPGKRHSWAEVKEMRKVA